MSKKFLGWKIFLGERSYKAALAWQERMVRYRRDGSVRDTLFFLTHPDTITLGKDIKKCDIRAESDIEIFNITRGGGVTYHGPGQLVVYPIFDLRRRGRDLHRFINDLEEGIIRAFADYGIKCGRSKEHTGVWVENRKIASIGIAVSRWISFHGAAINLTTNLNKFQLISPCGLEPEIMTNAMKESGKKIKPEEFAGKLAEAYSGIFKTTFYDVALEEIIELIEIEDAEKTL